MKSQLQPKIGGAYIPAIPFCWVFSGLIIVDTHFEEETKEHYLKKILRC